jgi:S-adenosyl methyltransferase
MPAVTGSGRTVWDGVDLDRPNVGRVYDYILGGTDHYAVDRAFAERVIARFPVIRPAAMANRVFLRRVVRHLVKRGIRQFVDVGSGVPTMGPTHEVADELRSGSKVVYVDNEPVAVAHGHILLERDGDPTRHAVVQADLRDPTDVVHKVAATGLIDWERPVALLLIAVLHVGQPGQDGDDVAPDVVAEYRRLLPSRSYLAISHATPDGVPEATAREMTEVGRMYDSTATPLLLRSRAEIESFFGDLELVEPGATWVPLWHPEENGPKAPQITFDNPNESMVWAGVAYKP